MILRRILAAPLLHRASSICHRNLRIGYVCLSLLLFVLILGLTRICHFVGGDCCVSNSFSSMRLSGSTTRTSKTNKEISSSSMLYNEYFHHSHHVPNKTQQNIKSYGSHDIQILAEYLEQFRSRLLVFNGSNFVLYNLEPRNRSGSHTMHQCYQCRKILPLLVHTLMGMYPQRFQKGQPVFQLYFTDADYFSSKCVNPGKCPVSNLAPVLLFGSAPMNSTELPFVKGFPHVYYTNCLYDFKVG
jgi:hypothetical protein